MHLNHYRAGSGEPLVLIHGIGSRWQVWNPVLSRLAAEREVIALDLPGFGASPPPPAGTSAGVRSLTDLVAGFLDELGLREPHVGGNSLGGWIALELAKRGRARSAIALSPAGFHDDREGAYARASLWVLARGARAMAPHAERLLGSPLARKLAFGQILYRPERISPAEAGETIRALAGAAWFDETLPALISDRFAGGDQIEVPTTIAWGVHDRLLLLRQSQRALHEIPVARLVRLEGCGHVPTYDDPDRVAGVLLAGSAGR